MAASAPAHTATILTAKVGDLQAQARIRVVPDLPWKFDFADGQVPDHLGRRPLSPRRSATSTATR